MRRPVRCLWRTQPAHRQKLACAHCHASRAQLEAGGISPGPPWPGTLARTTLKGVAGLPAADAVVRCGSHYQTRAPSPQEARDILAFLEGQGGALPGQPAVYDPTPRDEALAKTLLALPPDLDQGEAVFARACARCHRNGPDTRWMCFSPRHGWRSLRNSFRSRMTPGSPCRTFPAAFFRISKLVDVAAYVSPVTVTPMPLVGALPRPPRSRITQPSASP
jgi:mono/diheme cytochrome c family protein